MLQAAEPAPTVGMRVDTKKGRRKSVVELSNDSRDRCFSHRLQSPFEPLASCSRCLRIHRRSLTALCAVLNKHRLIATLRDANPLCTAALPGGAELSWSDAQIEMFYGKEWVLRAAGPVAALPFGCALHCFALKAW